MKKYRVSGLMDEVGAVQSDIEANSPDEAKEIALTEKDFYQVINVTELTD